MTNRKLFFRLVMKLLGCRLLVVRGIRPGKFSVGQGTFRGVAPWWCGHYREHHQRKQTGELSRKVTNLLPQDFSTGTHFFEISKRRTVLENECLLSPPFSLREKSQIRKILVWAQKGAQMIVLATQGMKEFLHFQFWGCVFYF